ncbi:MAG: 5-oxoprolinase [Gemmatimonadetes bacterium]|nr:5-oxoprolinase [Gemmatimonadota bacterium]|tara:strand:+ start:4039 stop:5751 length:1713 start_codon:yes stop_codon:yes gene_type:complete
MNDPIKFEVIRNALVETTEEMSAALRRSAYSTNIKTRCDYSCALFDRDINVLAQCFAQANHLGSMVRMVPLAIRDYGHENLGPGDTIVMNDPYLGGVHLNDIFVISPIYFEGEIQGYVSNLAHHVDVGGGAPASVGAFSEVFQEGIIIPPVKLAVNGEINRDVFRLILNQIRSKRETAGDFRAQIAANNTGAKRFAHLLERYGVDTVSDYANRLIEYADRLTRDEVAKLPHGEYTAEGVVDNDGFTEDPVKLAVRVAIDDDGILFDFTGCDPERPAPVNSTYSMTYAAAAYVLRCVIDIDVPINAGFYRSVRLIAPEGTVAHCTPPSPVVGGWETHTRIVEVIFKALSRALPERVPAGTKGMICHSGFGGIDPSDGEYYCFLETMGGGYGGRFSSDGPDAVQAHGQNTENAPIEETEMNYPVRIVRYELVDDSEGPGKFRGGLGLRRDYEFLGGETSFTILSDRDRWGPPGLFGGLDGRKASYVVEKDGESRKVGSKVTFKLQPGEIVSYRTCGGGGFRAPEERDPALVLKDVREGKVSLSRARDIYCVAVDVETWTVDKVETARLRKTD